MESDLYFVLFLRAAEVFHAVEKKDEVKI